MRLRRRNYLKEYRFAGDDPLADMAERYGYEGPLAEIFTENRNTLVDKWHHYLPVYEAYFSQWRGTPFRFLEIGVFQGGSLDMWRRYFGEEATIFGIDIDPECAQYDGKSGHVRIGSQDDPEFLKNVVEEMGGVDVILDDGSHEMPHVRKSLQVLYPLLQPNGIYMIEDLHTAYWKKYGGGHRARGNFFNVVGELVEDMHHWFHEGRDNHPGIGTEVDAIHVHNSIVVLEKGANPRPARSQVQNGELVTWKK